MRQDSTSTDGSHYMSGGSGFTTSRGGESSVPNVTFRDVQIALGLRSAGVGVDKAPAPRQRRKERSRSKGKERSSTSTGIKDLGRALSGRLRRLSSHAGPSTSQPKSRPTSAASARYNPGFGLTRGQRRLPIELVTTYITDPRRRSAFDRCDGRRASPRRNDLSRRVQWERNLLNLNSSIGSEEDNGNSSLKLHALNLNVS